MSKRNLIYYVILSIIIFATALVLDDLFNYFKNLASLKFAPIYNFINIVLDAAVFGLLIPSHVLLASKLKGKTSWLIVIGFILMNIVLVAVCFMTRNLTTYISQAFIAALIFAGVVELVNSLVQKKTDDI